MTAANEPASPASGREIDPAKLWDMLEAELAERPDEQASLWECAWGAGGRDAQWARHARRLREAQGCETLLVHGRYGTGKTSFLRLLAEEIRRSPGGQGTRTIWLHMPVLCPRRQGHGVATVLSAIVEELVTDPGVAADSQRVEHLQSALRDLWQLESLQNMETSDAGLLAPRPNRMGPSQSQPGRIYRANTLETLIEDALKAAKGEAAGGQGANLERLVVFLDDLDRCHEQVAVDVVRLLLRFGNVSRVHFVIACDRDVLENGVRLWLSEMEGGGNSPAAVTASSALMKYLHRMVAMPELAHPSVKPKRDASQTVELGWLKGWGEGLVVDQIEGGEREPMLADCFVAQLIRRAVMRVQAPEPSLPSGLVAPLPQSETALVGRPADPADTPRNPSSAQEAGYVSEKPELLNPQRQTERKDDRLLQATLGAVIQIDRQGGVWIRPAWQPLLSCLTLRQFKHRLREDMFSASTLSQPWRLALLNDLYHPIWRLRREDEPSFELLSALARQVIRSTRWVRDRGLLRIPNRLLVSFEQAAAGLMAASPEATQDQWLQCWPRKHAERQLLILLLAQCDTDELDAGELTAAVGAAVAQEAVERAPRPGGGSVQPGSAAAKREEMARAGLDFSNWVQKTLGRTPRGRQVPDLISSFQDMALAESHGANREGAMAAAADFADSWLADLAPYFVASTATSLSNLAVMLDAEPLYPAQCDQLFRAAFEGRGGSKAELRVPMFWAEFLLDVLDAGDSWEKSLLDGSKAHYADREALRRWTHQLLSEHTDDSKLTVPEQVYRQVLLTRLDLSAHAKNLQTDAARFAQLLQDLMPTLVTACRAGDTVAVVRVADALAERLGFTPLALRAYVSLLMPVWETLKLEADGLGAWTMAMQIANQLVGVSDHKSSAERLGLRLNAWLLLDPGAQLADMERVASLWSQSALALRGYRPKDAHAQAACANGMLIALAEGGAERWVARAQHVLEGFGLQTDGSAEAMRDAFFSLLPAEQQQRLREQLEGGELLAHHAEWVKLMFEDVFELMPIRDLQDFREAHEQAA